LPECSGEGSTYRVITKLWRSYFRPPTDTGESGWYERRERPASKLLSEHPQARHARGLRVVRRVTMLKITPQSALQFNPLDDPPDFDLLELPPKWTGEHCALRLCEGFKTLRQLPHKGASFGFKNGWSCGISTSGKIF